MEIPLPATASDPQVLFSGFSSWCPDAVLEAPKNQNPLCAATVSLEITHLDPWFASYFPSTRKAFLALHEWPFHVSNPWVILIYSLTHSYLVSIHVPPSSFPACLQASVCFFLSSSVHTTYYGSKEKKESQVCTTLLGWLSWCWHSQTPHHSWSDRSVPHAKQILCTTPQLPEEKLALGVWFECRFWWAAELFLTKRTWSMCHLCHELGSVSCLLERFGSCFLLDDWKLTTKALFECQKNPYPQFSVRFLLRFGK